MSTKNELNKKTETLPDEVKLGKNKNDGRRLEFIGGHISADLKEEFVRDGKLHFRSTSQQINKAIHYYLDHVKKGLIID